MPDELTIAHRERLPAADSCVRLQQGLPVGRVCIGATGDPRVVHEAFDSGLSTFFLSADLHWPLYGGTRRGLAELLRERRIPRERVRVVVASYCAHPDFVPAALHDLLTEVAELRYVDVVCAGGLRLEDSEPRLVDLRNVAQAHGPSSAALAGSFHDRAAALAAMSSRKVDLAFVRFNALHLGAYLDLFARIPRADRCPLFTFKSVIPRSFWERGPPSGFVPQPEDGYRFALSHEEIDGILVGPANLAELRALLAALSRGPLTVEEIGAMVELAATIAKRAARPSCS